MKDYRELLMALQDTGMFNAESLLKEIARHYDFEIDDINVF
jgi:hypothetical protein